MQRRSTLVRAFWRQAELYRHGYLLTQASIADKTVKSQPKAPADRFKVLQWVHWLMANLGPRMGSANHFKNYAKNIADDPKQLEYGTNRFVGRSRGDYAAAILDSQPANAGAQVRIAAKLVQNR
jgi:glutathione S-transferase